MQRVSAEGTWFFYFSPADSLELGALPLDVSAPNTELVTRVVSDGVRLVLFNNMLNRARGSFYFLAWPRGLDLDLVELDGRVLDGSYVDADFSRSTRTVYQDTICDACAKTWPTLVIPPGDPYPDAPELLARKIAAAKFERCPSCGAPFRQLVVRVLGQQ